MPDLPRDPAVREARAALNAVPTAGMAGSIAQDNRALMEAADAFGAACVAAGQRAPTTKMLDAINKACAIIELGDNRLLASDGPAGGLPPDISLEEWRTLYVTLDNARKAK